MVRHRRVSRAHRRLVPDASGAWTAAAIAVVLGGTMAASCGGRTGGTATDAGPDGGGGDHTDAEAGTVHAPCPTGMVRVGWSAGVAFCIDSTEVTNAQYQSFLTAAAAKPPVQNASCPWNTSLAPQTTTAGCPAFNPVARADFPVVCVNWCDADAYCKSIDKYLCGAGSTDGNVPGPVTNPLASGGSQSIIACTNDGMVTYPYGTVGLPGVCVDKKFISTTPGVQPVMSAAGCQGGVAGLYDMSGNASEWQDNCVTAAAAPATPSDQGKNDECDTYGGAASSDYSDTSCAAAASATDTVAHFTRSQVAADNGFRCCANAQFF